MSRGMLLASCCILFVVSAAITFNLAGDDNSPLPRPQPQEITADAPTVDLPPAPVMNSRREQLKKLIDGVDAPNLAEAMPIAGVVQKKDRTPIAGATIRLKPQLQSHNETVTDPEERLIQWIERKVQENRMTSDGWQTTSDENGHFEFTGLSLTRYLVSAQHPRWSLSPSRRRASPGSMLVFEAREPNLEVDIQVRLADGSIPSAAEVAIASGRKVTSPEASNMLRLDRNPHQQSTLINLIASDLKTRFRPWTPSDSSREVLPGYNTIIARTSDGQVSDPVEVLIEESSGARRIVLEIVESGSVQIDVAQEVQSRSRLQYFLLQIDKQRPPPIAALRGGLSSDNRSSEWPQLIPRVPPGAYMVGIGSDDVIWGYEIIEVHNQRVEVLIDLSASTEGNFIIARVVDGLGKPIKATFRRRTVSGGGYSTGSVDSILEESEGLYRIAMTAEEASAEQFFLTATTDNGSIELEVGDEEDPLLEYRFGSSAEVKIHYSGLDDLWRVPTTLGRVRYSFKSALVSPGKVVEPGKWRSLSMRISGFGGSGFFPVPDEPATQSARGSITQNLGTVQGGKYDLVVGTEFYHQTLEVLRVPITVGDVDLEIPIAMPPLYPIEVLQEKRWPFQINAPDGTAMHVFLDEGETTVLLPAGNFEFLFGGIEKIVVVPLELQVDLRREEQ